MASADDEDSGARFQPDPKAKLMHEVAEQMDELESDFPDGFEIGRVITIIEVKRTDGNIGLRIRAGMYPWVALGMLRAAATTLERGGAGSDGGGEE